MARFLITLSVAVALLSGTAMADLSGITPYVDPLGFTWYGSTSMSGQDPQGPGILAADVEWVVEWDYGASAFKYTYQIHGTGDIGITKLSVPMLPSNEAVSIGAYELEIGNIAPSAVNFEPAPPAEPTSAAWNFSSLLDGEDSYALTYYSVNVPLMLGGFIQDGGLFAVGADIPSPSNEIPEPATMALLGLGVVALVRRRR